MVLLLEACIVQMDAEEGHVHAVMTELFEENLGDYTILQIPAGGIKNSVQRRLKVASMCELDWWKRVLVLFLKESRKRKEPDAPRRHKGQPSGTHKKIRKSPRRLEVEFSSSDKFWEDVECGGSSGKKDGPGVGVSGKEDSKKVAFEGEGVPSKLPPPGEQVESPVPGATQSSAGGNPFSSPANSRFSRTNNVDGSVV